MTRFTANISEKTNIMKSQLSMWKPHFKDEVLQSIPLVDIIISSRSVSSTVKVDFVPGSPGPVWGPLGTVGCPPSQRPASWSE